MLQAFHYTSFVHMLRALPVPYTLIDQNSTRHYNRTRIPVNREFAEYNDQCDYYTKASFEASFEIYSIEKTIG